MTLLNAGSFARPTAASLIRLVASATQPTPQEFAEQRGHPHTDESRAKISAANKGKKPWNVGVPHSAETRALIAQRTREAMLRRKEQKRLDREQFLRDNPEMAVKLEEEERQQAEAAAAAKAAAKARRAANAREARAAAKANRTTDAKARKPRSATKPRNFTFTEEQKKRISESVKKRWQDPEYRAKRRNITVSAETRKKLSQIMKDKWKDQQYRSNMPKNGTAHSADRRRKISEAVKARWQDPAYREKTLDAMHAARGIISDGTDSKATGSKATGTRKAGGKGKKRLTAQEAEAAKRSKRQFETAQKQRAKEKKEAQAKQRRKLKESKYLDIDALLDGPGGPPGGMRDSRDSLDFLNEPPPGMSNSEEPKAEPAEEATWDEDEDERDAVGHKFKEDMEDRADTFDALLAQRGILVDNSRPVASSIVKVFENGKLKTVEERVLHTEDD